MELIQTTTVGSGGASTIDFTSIPAIYTDLCLVVSGRSTVNDTADQVLLRFNSDTANSYKFRWLVGNGSSASSNGSSAASFVYLGYMSAANTTASTFGNIATLIPNYAGSAAKTLSSDAVHEINQATATGINGIFAGYWSGTSAITSISLFSGQGANFAQYSTASLYGILKGSGGATVS